MSDPLSVVAVAAAVGGLASKVAEKTWDSAERWLGDRFGTHASSVREQARTNTAEFVLMLAERVRALEDRRQVDASTLKSAERHPQFASLLQDTLLNAAQTDDRAKHALLADIIAVRLASGSETTAALASPLAGSAVARATSRQLQMLGLMCVVDELRPKRLDSAEHFRSWLSMVLAPFAGFEFQRIDALHLVALSCIAFHTSSERDLSSVLNMKAILLLHQIVDFEGVYGFRELQGNWDEGLAGVQLTSVGSIIGGLVFNRQAGASLELPEWP